MMRQSVSRGVTSPSVVVVLAALLGLTLLTIVSTVNAAAGPHVVELDPTNIDSIVGLDKPVFVKFYADWCGHCKNMAPTWNELGEAFKHADVVIAKLNADSHKELGAKFNIEGYPTLKYFPKGSLEAEDYNGGRDLNDFAKFIEEKTAFKPRIVEPHSDVLTLTSDNFDDVVLNGKNKVFVEFYAPWCGHCKQLAPKWETLGTVFASEANVIVAKLDATAHPSVAEKFSVKGYPTLKLFLPGVDEPVAYNGPRTVPDLVTFMNKECGTHRLESGMLNDEAGVLENMADYVKRFMGSAADKQADLFQSIQDQTASIVGREPYLVVMKNLVKKGSKYLSTEAERLQRLLESDTVTQLKKDAFTVRKNVVRVFSSLVEDYHMDLKALWERAGGA